MRLVTLTALAAVLGLGWALADEKSDQADKEREKFQGTWTIVSMERGGKKAETPEAATVVFDGGNYRIKDGDKVFEAGTFRVGGSEPPYHIDVTVTTGEDKGMKWHGVYEIKGDTLQAVVGPEDKVRPKKLSNTDAGTRSFTVKREKRAKE